MTNKEVAEWCILQHQDTNHYYDEYLPYEFHLRMVVNVCRKFWHLLPSKFTTLIDVENACWGHDLIEDARKSYNDVKKVLGVTAADIIFAVSNEKGKTREEKANDKYYQGIRDTPGATFVKLCDRIANVQYGKLTNSGMFLKYEKENPHFLESIAADRYPEMKQYLINLFND